MSSFSKCTLVDCAIAWVVWIRMTAAADDDNDDEYHNDAAKWLAAVS